MLYNFLKILFQILFRVVFRASVEGRENIPKDGRLILAANHMSDADPPLIGCFFTRPVCYMAKEELFEIPVIGFIIRHCYSFPVHRGAADRAAIKTAVTILKQDLVLGIFPEGTRAKNGRMHKAEAGVGLIAAMTGAPVLPTAIVGTDKIFANGGFLPKLRVIYGKPMKFTGNRKDKEELEAFSQSILDEIARMKAPYENQ